jgi:hypothetical protein
MPSWMGHTVWSFITINVYPCWTRTIKYFVQDCPVHFNCINSRGAFVVRLWRCFSARWDKRHTDPSPIHDPRKHDKENAADTTTGHSLEDDSEEWDKDGEVGLNPPQAQSSGSMMEKAQLEICIKVNFIVKPENLRLNDRCKLESSAREQQGTQKKADDFSGGKSKGRPPSISICALDYLWTIVKYNNKTH